MYIVFWGPVVVTGTASESEAGGARRRRNRPIRAESFCQCINWEDAVLLSESSHTFPIRSLKRRRRRVGDSVTPQVEVIVSGFRAPSVYSLCFSVLYSRDIYAHLCRRVRVWERERRAEIQSRGRKMEGKKGVGRERQKAEFSQRDTERSTKRERDK